MSFKGGPETEKAFLGGQIHVMTGDVNYKPLAGTLYLGDAYDMKEVTKEQFKEIYFKLGSGAATGWDLEYWNEFFEDEKIPGMKYLLEEPETPKHARMMIVTDYDMNEYRLFFLTEESEESLFYFPDESCDRPDHR